MERELLFSRRSFLQTGSAALCISTLANSSLGQPMKLREAKDAVDHLVLAVNDLQRGIEWVEQKSENNFILHGMRYSPCFELDKVEVVSNKKDTLSILPIMKQVSDFCPMKGMPVAYPVKLDFREMKMKSPLLHVRTLDGKSVNSIVNLEGRR